MSGGLFVTFEGIDGCGKSTQVAVAEKKLGGKGREVLVTREPGGTPVAERIRALVMDARHSEMADRCEVLLYLASRAQHVAEVIEPALQRGAVVLCDRFEDATFAYQGYGRGISLEELRRLNSFATCGRRPDRTFVFDLDVEVAVSRLRGRNEAPDRLENSSREFYERIREGYLALAASDSARFTVVDSQRTVEEIAVDVDATLAADLTRRPLS